MQVRQRWYNSREHPRTHGPVPKPNMSKHANFPGSHPALGAYTGTAPTSPSSASARPQSACMNPDLEMLLARPALHRMIQKITL